MSRKSEHPDIEILETTPHEDGWVSLVVMVEGATEPCTIDNKAGSWQMDKEDGGRRDVLPWAALAVSEIRRKQFNKQEKEDAKDN